jgi:hypothetical protein
MARWRPLRLLRDTHKNFAVPMESIVRVNLSASIRPESSRVVLMPGVKPVDQIVAPFEGVQGFVSTNDMRFRQFGELTIPESTAARPFAAPCVSPRITDPLVRISPHLWGGG